MPRPIKCRKVCHFPDILEFRPSNKNGGRGEEDEKEVILLTVDEYETIRLIDKEGYSQEQCAGFMRIEGAKDNTVSTKNILTGVDREPDSLL